MDMGTGLLTALGHRWRGEREAARWGVAKVARCEVRWGLRAQGHGAGLPDARVPRNNSNPNLSRYRPQMFQRPPASDF